MRRILQRHGIQHANTAEHIESLDCDATLHSMQNSLAHCMRTWFAPGTFYYIPMSSTNWSLQRNDPDVDASHLTIKRIEFMNAGRYLQDYISENGQHDGTLGARKSALVNKLAYHSRRYASALQDLLLRHPSVAISDCEEIDTETNSWSRLLFRWTRTGTHVEHTERLCEYSTHSALDECVLSWCTAVATCLTLKQYAEAASAVYLMAGIMTIKTEKGVAHRSYHVNAFSPPLIDVPDALIVTIRDTIMLLRDISKVDDTSNALACALTCQRSMQCFEHGSGLSRIPAHTKGLCVFCARVLRNSCAFLRIRDLLRVVKECKWRCKRESEAIAASYHNLQKLGIDNCSDYVVAEMAKLDIAFSMQSKPGAP